MKYVGIKTISSNGIIEIFRPISRLEFAPYGPAVDGISYPNIVIQLAEFDSSVQFIQHEFILVEGDCCERVMSEFKSQDIVYLTQGVDKFKWWNDYGEEITCK